PCVPNNHHIPSLHASLPICIRLNQHLYELIARTRDIFTYIVRGTRSCSASQLCMLYTVQLHQFSSSNRPRNCLSEMTLNPSLFNSAVVTPSPAIFSLENVPS